MVSGCEMRKCKYLTPMGCGDDDPRYLTICRYNDYWQTEEGQKLLKEFEAKEANNG